VVVEAVFQDDVAGAFGQDVWASDSEAYEHSVICFLIVRETSAVFVVVLHNGLVMVRVLCSWVRCRLSVMAEHLCWVW
jgi:hypothetical protein